MKNKILLIIFVIFSGCAQNPNIKAFLIPPERMHREIKSILIMPSIYPYDDMNALEKKDICHKIDEYIYNSLLKGTNYIIVRADSVYHLFEPSDTQLILFTQSGYWNEAVLYNLRQPLIKKFNTDAILQVVIGKSIANVVDGEVCWNGVCRNCDDLGYEPSVHIIANAALFFFGYQLREKGEVTVSSIYGELFNRSNDKLWRDAGGLAPLMLIGTDNKTYDIQPYRAFSNESILKESIGEMIKSLVIY